MKIIGTGSALPSLTVTNKMLSEFLDTNDTWIFTRTGIKKRRIISTETLLDLAVAASKKAIKKAGLKATDIDFIICSNVANNYVVPSLSAMIQGEIKATCPCFDINAACTGFIYASDIAETFLQTKRAKNILIVCAEEPTRFCNWKERDTSVLFGDGAGAVVVTAGDDMKSIRLTTTSNTDVLYYSRTLESTPYLNNNEQTIPLVMHGRDLFKIAVSAAVEDINIVLDQAGITAENVDYFLIHQSNKRMIDSIRHTMEQSVHKFPHNIEKYGNTSSASILILMDEMSRKSQLKKGDTLVLSAFGGGFTSGAMVITWNLNE